MYVSILWAMAMMSKGRSWPRIACVALVAFVAIPLMRAQTPGGQGASYSSRAVMLPPSAAANPGGTVSAQQSASPGGGVNTVNSTLQVTGNFAGSIPAVEPGTGPITLSLADAVKRGLQANLGPIVANDTERAARAERIQALSALLPSISANLSGTVTQVNLAAYGFKFNVPPNFGFSIPSVVGPYTYSQAQASMSLPVYDAVNRRNWQAAKHIERAADLSARDTRELVVMAVAGTYLQTLYTQARIASQTAQVENAQAIYDQAQTRKTAGVNSKIDVMRSLVQLQTDQQLLSSLQADLRKQKIALARVLGLPLDRDLMLSNNLGWENTPVPEAATVISTAWKKRSDLQAMAEQVQAAERAVAAARAERLPSANVNGDYGVIGANPTSTHGVFAVTAALNIPIWQGGRAKGDIQQAEATLHQRQAELADQKAHIEQDVRTALVELETNNGQVRLAETNRNYANETLSEARDRFAAGVATTVEVVQAQQQVASAEADYLASLFSFDLAKLSLARATGSAEQDSPNLLKTSQP
jgi:outer membrane protein TolC